MGLRVLITAGPTHEPIDAVRYIANRSSGRLGIAIAEASVARGWSTTLLLGPTARVPADSRVRVIRFRTTADLERRLMEEFPSSDVFIQAAAVADYRPIASERDAESVKIRRSSSSLKLELEPTPDLLAAMASRRSGDQTIVGFALEPAERLLASATEKLERKRLDMVVANPLETMDSDSVQATILTRRGERYATPGAIEKQRFGGWLLDLIAAFRTESVPPIRAVEAGRLQAGG